MHFLRTDPQFYAKTPHELLADAAYWVKKADLKLKDTIGFLPRFRHGILPVPEALAPIYTGGRGGLESCLFNTYNLTARRSEERRVGNGGVSTCRSRWSP